MRSFWLPSPCSAHEHEINTNCFIVFDLEYFVASRQWTFLLQFLFKDDRQGSDHTCCTKSNMCYFFWDSTNTMLSVLFAAEAGYTIKENSDKEKSFCQGKLPFCWCKLIFCQQKLRNAFFASTFSCRRKKIWIARVDDSILVNDGMIITLIFVHIELFSI